MCISDLFSMKQRNKQIKNEKDVVILSYKQYTKGLDTQWHQYLLHKLQATVFRIVPSATVIFSNTIGLSKTVNCGPSGRKFEADASKVYQAFLL